MSLGFYSPSPGVIYPALTYLEELGYASVAAEGSKKLYAITPEGQAYLEQNRGALDQMFEQVAWVAGKMSKLRQAFGGAATEDPLSPRNGALAEVWHELRKRTTSMIVEGGAPAEQRVIEILKRALGELKNQ
jgi:DNA-binding PadR family transcriptional regulator